MSGTGPFHQIKRKVEDAFAFVIKDKSSGTLNAMQIAKGVSAEALVVPRIQVLATIAVAEMYADTKTGNYHVTIGIGLVHNYEDIERDDRVDLEKELFDIIMRDDLISDLNAAEVEDFAVFGGSPGEGEGIEVGELLTEVNQSEIMESLKLVVYCKPSGVEGG